MTPTVSAIVAPLEHHGHIALLSESMATVRCGSALGRLLHWPSTTGGLEYGLGRVDKTAAEERVLREGAPRRRQRGTVNVEDSGVRSFVVRRWCIDLDGAKGAATHTRVGERTIPRSAGRRHRPPAF